MGDGKISEWTAPSTGVVVFYQHWPTNTGKSIPPEDFTVVGSIGELQNWIVQSRNDWYFMLHDIIFALIALVVGSILWSITHLSGDKAS
jgi:hypothetical protein